VVLLLVLIDGNREKNNSFYDDLIAHADDDIVAPAVKQPVDDRQKQKEKELANLNKPWNEKSLEFMTAKDWRACREAKNISTRGAHIPNPIRKWKETDPPLVNSVVETVLKQGYREPTNLQAQLVPTVLARVDALAVSDHGSGKRGGYLFPLYTSISTLPRVATLSDDKQGPYALIVLASITASNKVEKMCHALSSAFESEPILTANLNLIASSGDDSNGSRVSGNSTTSDIVFGTPGAVLAYIQSGKLSLSNCVNVVLDGADTLMKKEEATVRSIMSEIPSSNLPPSSDREREEDKTYRHTIFLSSTMPSSLESLAKQYLSAPVFIATGTGQ